MNLKVYAGFKTKPHEQKRLFVADPSLDDLRGHHYGLSVTIADAGTEAGYEVAILTNKRGKQALSKNAHYRFLPLFSASIYFVDEIKGQKEPGDYFYSEFLQFLREEHVASDDVVLFHTAIGEVYAGLLLLINRLNQKEVKTLPEIHLCTPYNEDLMPGNLRGRDLCKTISMISSQCALKDGKVYFWVENKSLVNHYAVRTSVNHVPLHIPLRCRLSVERVVRADLSEKPIVSYLGAAREEKGFLKVVELLRAYRDSLYHVKKAKANIQFFIHCVPQKVGYTPSIRNAINELEALKADLDIVLWNEPLAEAEYHAKMEESAAIFLLYDERYRVRGSGILAEALTMGCRIIATPDSVCALYADRNIDCVSSDMSVKIQYLFDMTNVFDETRQQQLVERTKENRHLHDPRGYLRRIEARQKYQHSQGSFYAILHAIGGYHHRMIALDGIDSLEAFKI
ncbi:hypothetical protein ThidrDRAFT_3690 [Thiorhodococcus drewsii AZ1]|uniref:Glycosyl transferase group 1 n=1 Tax=Thiorhodococcus drewsii AZ1 TaxID=765913 RepID=G2E5X7_9GAMM|nr:glycosyltransferase [Thiorhodococcus drewsii]EGV28540.1 hypothetical protein ThidrDRAFT_3690 [Thiorhodococcus drewsii AZ1]